MICYNTRPLWYFFYYNNYMVGLTLCLLIFFCLGDSFGVDVLPLFDSCFVTSLQINMLQSYIIRLGKKLQIK
jgi:hypothetical protein